MDFGGPAFHLVLHVRSTSFIVTLKSPHSAAFFKACSVHGQPHGPWHYLGTCFVLLNCWVVFNVTSSFSVFRSLLFLSGSWKFFASFSIEALGLNPDNIGRRKRKGCFWTSHGSPKDHPWEFPRLTIHPVHRRNGCILLFPAHSLLCPPPS